MNVLLDGIDFNQEWAFERFSKFINKETRILIVPFAFHDELNEYLEGKVNKSYEN